MKKYMFVIPSLSKGGAEKVVSLLSSSLADTGAEVVVVKFFDVDGEYPVSQNVKVINLSGGSENTYQSLGKLERLKRIRKYVKAENPDLVIPFLGHVRVMTRIACSFLKVNYIHTVRVDPRTEFASKSPVQLFSKNTLLNGKKIWVQNQAQKEYFSEKTQKKVFILPNPVSEDFLNSEKDYSAKSTYTIIAAGRLKAQKNFEMLIKVCFELSQKYHDIELNIYGEGNQYAELSKLIDDIGAGVKIRLMGRSNNLLPVYAKSDLFVLSSNYEGMPNVLLEAMACGVPCVSTDCPTGPSEMIIDKKNGLLVPVNDCEQMKKAIEFMYNNREAAAQMGREAKHYAKENYSIKKITEDFEKAVEEKERSE